MGLMQVEIPAGLVPGDQMSVSADGGSFLVVVPDGCRGGDVLEVNLPVDDVPAAAATELVQVTIPNDCFAGDPLSVQAAWGGVFEVVVPAGLLPGDVMEVELPTEEAASSEPGTDARADTPTSAEEAVPSTAESEYAGLHKLGSRVSVLRTNGTYSPGTIRDYDYLSDTYTLELDGGALKYLVDEDSIAPLDYRPAKAGEHFVGRRVQARIAVARSL